MKRTILFGVALVFTVISTSANADITPRIALLHAPKSSPEIKEVKDTLVRQLSELDMPITIGMVELKTIPQTRTEWRKVAAKASQKPGTIAVFGYVCDKRSCHLYVIEPRRQVFLELPIVPEEESEHPLSFAVAATIRETLLGPLLPELDRLVRQGVSPVKPVSPDNAWVKPPYEKERKKPSAMKRSWLWVEGGYQGDHPHPKGHPLHGPWLGLDIEPAQLAGVAVNLGWLGFREAEVDGAIAKIHRLTSSIAIRLIVPIGPAHLSVAPVARFDAAFSQIDNVGRRDAKKSNFEFQVGGLTTWHIPLVPRVEVLVGAGVLVSVISEETEVYGAAGERDTAIPGSMIRMIWTAGIAWNPIR